MLCHSIYLQVVKVRLFNLGLPMNRYTFVLPSENQNAFRLLSICANAVYNVIQSLKDISSIKFFCKDIHESFKYVDKLSELKKMTQFKKNTHLSLSLYLSIYRKYAKCRAKADAHDKMGFQCISISVDIVRSHARIQRGDSSHLKNHKNIEFLSNTGPDPLKFSKTTKPAFNVGSSSARQRNAIERRFAGGPMMARFL